MRCVEMRVERDNFYVYPVPEDDQVLVEVYGETRKDAVEAWRAEAKRPYPPFVTVVDFAKGVATDHELDADGWPK